MIFGRLENEFRVYQLNGGHYQEIIGHGGRFWIPKVDLGLGIWNGSYDGLKRNWIRWFDANQNWIPTKAERAEQESRRAEAEYRRAEQESQRAEQESQRAEQESQRAREERRRAEEEFRRAERLAERLRQLGADPEQL